MYTAYQAVHPPRSKIFGYFKILPCTFVLMLVLVCCCTGLNIKPKPDNLTTTSVPTETTKILVNSKPPLPGEFALKKRDDFEVDDLDLEVDVDEKKEAVEDVENDEVGEVSDKVEVDSAESMESIKIQDILRHIFVDEFEETDAAEEVEESPASAPEDPFQYSGGGQFNSLTRGRIESLNLNHTGRQRQTRNTKIEHENDKFDYDYESDDYDRKFRDDSADEKRKNVRKNSKNNGESSSIRIKPAAKNHHQQKKNSNEAGGGKKNGGKNGKNKNGRVNVDKYNQYMDAVLKRMNTLIRGKRMDPLSVNLFASPSKTNGHQGNQGQGQGHKGPVQQKNNKNKNKGGGKKGQGNKNRNGPNKGNKNKGQLSKESRMELEGDEEAVEFDDQETPADAEEHSEAAGDFDFDSDSGFRGEEFDPNDGPVHNIHLNMDSLHRKIRSMLDSNVDGQGPISLRDIELDLKKDRQLSIGDFEDNSSRAGSKKGKVRTSHHQKENSTSEELLNSSISSGFEGVGNGTNPVKNQNHGKGKEGGNNKGKKGPRPTRGTLHGLSTLRREGNVLVVRQGPKARLVRAKFLLGPVALEIHPKKPRPSGERANNMAVATAPELKGILEVRLKQGSPTRIRKLRVFPPKKVQVEPENGRDASVARPKYNRVSPMATARLRQVALQVLQLADNLNNKNSNKKRVHNSSSSSRSNSRSNSRQSN